MERLTNENHKEMGLVAYTGEKNPYNVPLTIGELAGFITSDYSPREILEEVFARLAAYEDTGLTPKEVSEYQKLCALYVEAGLDAKFVQVCIDAIRGGVTVERIRELVESNAPLMLEELREIVEQLEFCGYQCEGGPLEMNKAFILLKDLAYRNKPSE